MKQIQVCYAKSINEDLGTTGATAWTVKFSDKVTARTVALLSRSLI